MVRTGRLTSNPLLQANGAFVCRVRRCRWRIVLAVHRLVSSDSDWPQVREFLLLRKWNALIISNRPCGAQLVPIDAWVESQVFRVARVARANSDELVIKCLLRWAQAARLNQDDVVKWISADRCGCQKLTRVLRKYKVQVLHRIFRVCQSRFAHDSFSQYKLVQLHLPKPIALEIS